MKDENQFYKRGAEYFGKDYDSLKNKMQYKEEYYLNTGLMAFREKSEIKIFTSCIADTEYLYQVIKEPLYCVTIYYYKSNVDVETLRQFYSASNVSFIKISKNPLEEFKHNTIAFASDDTIIFDEKELGLVKASSGNRKVYRDKSKEHFKIYYSRAEKLI